MRALDTIVIHYTATPPGWSDKFPDTDAVADEIRRWHKGRGWRDIGYHFVVGTDGTVALGRPVAQTGAGVRGHNAHTVHIAYIGGWDAQHQSTDTRTPEQTAAIRELIRDLRAEHGDLKVVGHRDLAATECPGFDVQTSDLLDEPKQDAEAILRQIEDLIRAWRRA